MAATDGVGTKVKIAIETGLHDTIGIDLVAMCVNDLVVQGAEPLFFLDYFASGKLDAGDRRAGGQGHRRGLPAGGCALIGGETAEMPGMYLPGDYDLAGFAVGAVERGALLPRADIAAGDVIIGLASSGVHSNGYSLVRKIVERAGLRWDRPCPVRARAQARRGAERADPHLCEVVPGRDPRHQAVSRRWPTSPAADFPTTSRACCPKGSARASILRASRCRRCSNGWRRPAASPKAEMLRTFNCGIGMVVVVDAQHADAVAAALTNAGETVTRLGTVMPAKADAPRVAFSGHLDLAW